MFDQNNINNKTRTTSIKKIKKIKKKLKKSIDKQIIKWYNNNVR